MCGIAGIIAPDAHRFKPHAERMLAALRHRGPDAQTMLEYPNAILAHTRLSIVDLAGGAQPMRSALDPNVAVTFNGEIYGYRELRDKIQGYPFRTNSDTEMIPALYHTRSKYFASSLPGMFAFALWDDTAQTLVAARDRFGEKPFYYATFADPGGGGETCFVFASEVKAILATGLITPILSRHSLGHYLQNLYVPPNATIYENIHTLHCAHMLHFHAGKVELKEYWRLPRAREEVAVDEAVEEFRFLFDQAVSRQLIADVPVGAFLSGGLDSSTVVALAARHNKNIQTFSFRFDSSLDETPFAAEVAAMHHTNHRVLEDTHVDLAGLLLEMAAVYDEPFADSSNIPTYLISKLAREHLKVVLTGDGGDELLAGYAWYRDLLAPPSNLPSGAPHTVRNRQHMIDRRLRHTLYFSDDTMEKFNLPPLFVPPKTALIPDTLDTALREDLRNYMPGDILVKIDRAAMAHGLELRAPFLDVDLASFLIALPARLKIDGASDKLLLRQAFSDLWPESVRIRGKRGFGAPVAEWLLRPKVAELVNSRLNDPRHPLFSLLPFDVTRIAVERKNYQTWILLTLALWLERQPTGVYARSL